MSVHPCAGNPVEPSQLIPIPSLVTAYYTGRSDPTVPAQRVVFGTSRHRRGLRSETKVSYHGGDMHELGQGGPRPEEG